MVKVSKNDFVQVQFTGKIKDTGEIFDTNIEKDAKEASMDLKNLKPFSLSIGHKMLPEGFDNDLTGKDIGKEYVVDIKPEKAFGKRDPQRVRMIPTKMFHEQNINPQRGMQLSLDGQLTRILSSSGGRTLVDFNNPLAGKEVTYSYKILKKLDDVNDKVNALQEFLFRRTLEFDIKDKKITFKVEKDIEPMIKLFSEKFEEILGLGLKIDTKIVESKGENNRDESQSSNPAHGEKGHVHGPDCDHHHHGHKH